MDTEDNKPAKKAEDAIAARRRFLASCGKYAAVTAPAVTLMLSNANRNYAVASSGRRNQNNNNNNNQNGNH
jgi:hypothetical protein